MFENEEWRVIEEFPNYLISQYGRVRHKDRNEVRKVALNNKGFPIIVLWLEDNPTRYLRQINVLVAKAFLDPPMFDDNSRFPQNQIWHKDGDLKNCYYENLMWETRPRVLEWNEMHRRGRPTIPTPKVRNNRTGVTYDSAYACAIAEGKLESEICWRVERQARHTEDPLARYMYIYRDSEMAREG